MCIVQITKSVIQNLMRLSCNIYIYTNNTEIRHWLNFWAVRLIWLRHELLRNILYLFFGFWGQYSEAKSQSHFSSCWRNSSITKHPLYVTREEGRVRADRHRWTSASSNVSHILDVSFSSLQIYLWHTLQLPLHSMTWLASMGPTVKCEHKALYAICTRIVRGHCAQGRTRLNVLMYCLQTSDDGEVRCCIISYHRHVPPTHLCRLEVKWSQTAP